MSYHLHITRRAGGENDAEGPASISREEWLEYLAGDAKMAPNDCTVDPQYGKHEDGAAYDAYVEGLSAWLGHSGKGLKEEYVWFSHSEGQVTVENPDEETLVKLLAIAQVLHARVQGDDGDYFDQQPWAHESLSEGGDVAWADADFRPFQTFASAEAAQPLLQLLARQGITARTSLDDGQLAFDPSFANNRLLVKFIVNLRAADFDRASQLLEQLNQHALDQVDPSHYVFSFTDDELFDMLVKPDEWSAFDVTLASQLLRQRGRDITPDTLRLLRQHRVAELAQPPEEHKAWVIGGYISSLLGGLLGILIGYQLYFHRKLLPDGRRVHAYSAAERVHGLRILVLGVVMMLVLVALRLTSSE